MAFNINTQRTFIETAGAKAAIAASQLADSTTVLAAQRVFQAVDLYKQYLGKPFEDIPQEQMGGLTPFMVMQLQNDVRTLGVSRKNRWFVRITDKNPPKIPKSRLDGVDIGGTINLLATEVTYAPQTMQSDKISVGSSVIDRLTGTDPVELQITTMDDGQGSIKHWFDGKCGQVAHSDGTFGLPSEYLVTVEIVHGVAASLEGELSEDKFYSRKFLMRANSITHELSRRDAMPAEITLGFHQYHTFFRP